MDFLNLTIALGALIIFGILGLLQKARKDNIKKYIIDSIIFFLLIIILIIMTEYLYIAVKDQLLLPVIHNFILFLRYIGVFFLSVVIFNRLLKIAELFKVGNNNIFIQKIYIKNNNLITVRKKSQDAFEAYDEKYNISTNIDLIIISFFILYFAFILQIFILGAILWVDEIGSFDLDKYNWLLYTIWFTIMLIYYFLTFKFLIEKKLKCLSIEAINRYVSSLDILNIFITGFSLFLTVGQENIMLNNILVEQFFIVIIILPFLFFYHRHAQTTITNLTTESLKRKIEFLNMDIKGLKEIKPLNKYEAINKEIEILKFKITNLDVNKETEPLEKITTLENELKLLDEKLFELN